MWRRIAIAILLIAGAAVAAVPTYVCGMPSVGETESHYTLCFLSVGMWWGMPFWLLAAIVHFWRRTVARPSTPTY